MVRERYHRTLAIRSGNGRDRIVRCRWRSAVSSPATDCCGVRRPTRCGPSMPTVPWSSSASRWRDSMEVLVVGAQRIRPLGRHSAPWLSSAPCCASSDRRESVVQEFDDIDIPARMVDRLRVAVDHRLGQQRPVSPWSVALRISVDSCRNPRSSFVGLGDSIRKSRRRMKCPDMQH